MPTDSNLRATTTKKTGLQGGAGGDVRGDNVAWSGGPPTVSPISLGDNTERAANFHPTTDYEAEAPLGNSVFTDSASKADVPAPTLNGAGLSDPSTDGDLALAWTAPNSATIRVECVLLTQNEFGDYVPVATAIVASNTSPYTFSGLTNGQNYKAYMRRSGDSTDLERGNSWGPFTATTAAVAPTV
jgi:hypothetical protein